MIRQALKKYKAITFLATILLVIGAGETLIMYFLHHFTSLPHNEETLIDVLSLSAFSFTILYFLSYKPLIMYIERQKKAEDELRLANESLETAIKDRTFELVEANIALKDNIAEEMRAKAQLISARQEWENTFDSINDIITIHDIDGNIVRANMAAKEILKLPSSKVADQIQCYLYCKGKDCPPHSCPSCYVMNNKASVSIERYEPELNMHLEITAIPRFDHGNNFIGVIQLARDIGERKKLEEQLRLAQKMEAIGQLAAGVAHDFNNIMSAICNYAYLIKEKTTDIHAIDYSEKILSLSSRASNITRSLLTFSRKQHFYPRPVDLNELIDETKKLLVSFIGEDISIISKSSDSDLTIMVDPTNLEQCIMNLATNARDAMPDGGSIIIETGAVEINDDFINMHGFGKPGMYALMSFSDTGEGITDETRQKMFDPFFTTKEVGKGTGLGLAIVYGIVTQHKGYINVYSELGNGTTFKIFFPLAKTDVVIEEEKKFSLVTGKGRTILVAEDEAEVRNSTCTILEKSGFKVILAENGIDAVGKFREHMDEIDLILLDVIMPKKSGKAAYYEMLKMKQGLKAIFLSGYSADLMQHKNIFEKGLNFVSKPVFPNNLLLKIQEVLESEYEYNKDNSCCG